MEIKNGYKKFSNSDGDIVLLNNVSVKFETGKFYTIIGHSGSGKTTLINILGLIDKLDKGKLIIEKKDVSNLSNNDIQQLRKDNIGFIFQDYCLNEYMTALENVMVPLLLNNKSKKENIAYAKKLLTDFGLENRLNHFPKKLSGGEQQRVSIARALANNPKYLLCDEPTGALDKKNERIVVEYLKELTNKNICVIVVTHNNEINKYADVIYELDDGKISEVKYENK